MIGGLGPQADFLDLDLGLRLARFALLLGLLVQELPVVEDPADRRNRVGCNLDQVEVGLLGDAQRLVDGDDADVLPIRADQAYFREPDLLVDAVL